MSTKKPTPPTSAELKDGAYKVPESEKHLFHVELEKKRFNMATGERLSKPTIQKYTEKQWALSKDRLAGLGFNSIIVLHDPAAE